MKVKILRRKGKEREKGGKKSRKEGRKGKIEKITREWEEKKKEERRQRLLPHICGLTPCICVCCLTNPSRGCEPVGMAYTVI
jgi:hypothetical protein